MSAELDQAWEDALGGYKLLGAAHARDSEVMAAFCQTSLQILVGAVSPKLVWQGAVLKGMGLRDLAQLANKDPIAVADLQWFEERSTE